MFSFFFFKTINDFYVVSYTEGRDRASGVRRTGRIVTNSPEMFP